MFEDYGDAEVQRSPDSKKKLEDALAQAEAVIIVVPLVDLQRAGFQGPLSRLISNLVTSSTRNADNKPHRIVVAFTHYERLFVRAGREAFGIATQKTVARNVILHALDQSQWAGDLQELFSAAGPQGLFHGDIQLWLRQGARHSERGYRIGEIRTARTWSRCCSGSQAASRPTGARS